MWFKKLVKDVIRPLGRKPKVANPPPPLVKTEYTVADTDNPKSLGKDNRPGAEPSTAPPLAKEASKVVDDPPRSGEHNRAAVESSPAPPAENHTLSTAGQAVKTALTVLKECLDGVPVPGLKAAVGGVLELIKIFEDVTGNREELDQLASRVMELKTQIELPSRRLPAYQLPAPLQSNAATLVSALNAMSEEAKRVSGRSFVDRTANHEAYKQMIQKLNVDIDRLIASFTMVTMNRIERARQSQGEERLIGEMPHAYARYDDASTRPSRPCHPNTRTDLRRIIGDWIDDESSTYALFWLCGEVGVGKTTVAHTIAKERDGLNQLGASFFFNRDHPQRRDSMLFASTIAYQLARFDPEVYEAVVDALRRNPDIVHRNLQEQFLQLVVQPLACSVKSPPRTILVVIDGLDECNDPVAILDILPLLTHHTGSRLRVLVTSRPHAAIITKFENTCICHLTSQSHFRDIDSDILNNDVKAYLEWSLGEIASEFQNSLPSSWPSADQINRLVRRTSGLFALASIFDRYIRDPVEGNPARQLERVLSRRLTRGSSPTAELDAMYDLVLNDIKQSLPKNDVDFARSLLQLTFLSSRELSVTDMSEVLDCTPADVQSVLRRMTSVIRPPSGVNGAITPFHGSFGEYIQDPERCSVKEFAIEPASSHAAWATTFLEIFVHAAENGTTGVEYDYNNVPPAKLQIAAFELPHHASRSYDPPTQLQQVKDTFCRGAIQTWIFIWYWSSMRQNDNQNDRVLSNQISLMNIVFTDACNIFGQMSLQHSMVKHILDQIPQPPIREPLPNNDTEETIHQGRRIINEADFQTFKIKLEWEGHLWTLKPREPRYFARILWKWSKLQHPNIVPLRRIDFESLLELLKGSTVRVPLTSHYPILKHIQHTSLPQAFQQNLEEAVQATLGLARALQHLLETGFYGGHNRYNDFHFLIDCIVLSREGKLMVHPLFMVYEDSVDPLPMDTERQSLAERGFAIWDSPEDGGISSMVWELGCVIYEMMTGKPPLKRFHDLIIEAEPVDDESVDGEAPLKAYRELIKNLGMSPPTLYNFPLQEYHYWWSLEMKPPYAWLNNNDIRLRRYQTAVQHLLHDLQVSEDLKGVLQACWITDDNNRPPIQGIIARLTAILEGLSNRNRGAM